MKRYVLAAVCAALACAQPSSAQIRHHPTGVNVNATGATTVFVTFGNLDGYMPVEAIWCGELVAAAPATGERCDPGTIFGALPLRYTQSRLLGAGPTASFTDIMSIPPSVARRAYQAAQGGADSRFFYVRRFVDPAGLRPDQFVSVTCRLTAGGARTPLALLDVRLRFVAGDEPVTAVREGTLPPPLEAAIAYNGTGRLVGRWEVVMPGEDPPTADDLLTEATLPAPLRGTQRRYTEVDRFSIFLPPTGEVVLPGPDPESLPVATPGLYQVLLRIEASDDKEGDSDLAAAGAGDGIVHAGAVAGFPLPPLLYFVGDAAPTGLSSNRLSLLAPAAGAKLASDDRLIFTWTQVASAVLYRLEVRVAGGDLILAAVTQPGNAAYLAPPWIVAEQAGSALEWRVQALDGDGEPVEETPWRALRVGG